MIEFKNAIQLIPQDAHAHYKLGLAYLKRGGFTDLQKSFQEFKKAADLDTTIIDAQLKLGELYLLSQRFAEAQEHAERVLKAAPDNLEAHALLGNTYAGQRKLAPAIEELRTALRLNPKLTKTYLNLATIHLLNNDTAAAEKVYRDALTS